MEDYFVCHIYPKPTETSIYKDTVIAHSSHVSGTPYFNIMEIIEIKQCLIGEYKL